MKCWRHREVIGHVQVVPLLSRLAYRRGSGPDRHKPSEWDLRRGPGRKRNLNSLNTVVIS